MADYEETVPSILLPCDSCSRTFRPEALAKHVKYCEKTLIKKRKVFDSAKQRIQGTDLAEFLPVINHKKKNEKSPIRKTQSKWKEKHMELVRAIRAARVAPSSDDQSQAIMKPSDHEKCPHCDRYFGPKAYDRHLEWCKEHRTRIQPKSPASIQAKERLEARTKYRAPVMIKSKRAITKEKYLPRNRTTDPSPIRHSRRGTDPSPMRQLPRTTDPSPMRQRQQSPPLPAPSRKISSSSISSKTTPVSLKEAINSSNNNNSGNNNTNETFKRQQSIRNSKRNQSPIKKPASTARNRAVTNQSNNNNDKLTKEKELAQHQKVELKEEVNEEPAVKQMNEDIFSASCNISAITPIEIQRPKLKTPTNHNSMETYDPYKSAERQMKELLGLTDKVENDKADGVSLISQPDLVSSPSSAFAKFSPIQPEKEFEQGDDSSFPPPSEFSDTIDRQSPPFTDAVGIVDRNLNPISLSSISLCSTISIESFDGGKNNNFRKGISTSAKVQSCDKRAQLPLKRSVSVVESPHRKGRDFLKNNLKMEHLLFGISGNIYSNFEENPFSYDVNDNSDENLRSSNELLKHSTSSLVDTSQAEQDLLKSVSEFEKLFVSPSSLKPLPALIPSSSPANQFPMLDDIDARQHHQSMGNKFSTDSAYNSLNRKSPQLESGTVENGSSSGSECSVTPATGRSRKESQGAKYCHECGAKFPVLAAKFCCNCGVRRLVI